MDFRQIGYYIAEPKTNKTCIIHTIIGCTIFCDFIRLDKDLNTLLRCYNVINNTMGVLVAMISIDDIIDIRIDDRHER